MKATKTTTFDFEYTDTFSGEANYSWVHRESVELPSGITDRSLVRRAKAFAGLTGCRCRVDSYGDSFSIYPQGSCTVLFITARY